jgi:hypothetical protein
MAIAQVRFDTPASPLFDAKLDVLRDYVLQHAQKNTQVHCTSS